MAAEYGRWNGEAYYENLWQTNTVGTKHVLRLQEKLGFKLIFFSSCEVYGDYDGFMTEDVMVNNKISDTYQMNDYAITKWAGELMCLNSTAMFGTEIVRVRPLNCYGPHEHFTPYRGFIPKFIYHALNDNTTGYSNTAIGAYALDSNTTGSQNIGIGPSALNGNTTGNSNVAMGYQALQYPEDHCTNFQPDPHSKHGCLGQSHILRNGLFADH